MERRGFGFFTKRSQHYDNLQQVDSQQHKLPLKDTTNTSISIKQEKLNNNEEAHSNQEPESTQQDSNNQPGSRSLQCLETLAQKAGIHDITADDCKYDIANTLLNLDRGHEFIKQSVDSISSNNMADIKQQQIVDANAQAQAQAQAVQQQQQQMQQVSLQQQQEQQALVPAQSPHQLQQVTVGGQLQATTSMGPPQHTVSMHQQVAQQGQVLQTQGGQVLTAAQTGSTTITTMSPLQQSQAHSQQLSTDWTGRAVQVIQQPIQNHPTYLPQLYNPQGQLLMPSNISNIALHPSINPQQIQVIAKPFQGNQLAPHMITTAQGKQVLQGSQGATFPGYTTIPTIPTTQNQTLVFSQLGVISSQPNILPNHSQGNAQVAQQKPQEMHKVMGGQKVMQKVASSTGAVAQTQQQGQCVQVSQAMIGTQPTAQIISPLQTGGQPMQFTPWQFTATNGIPQVWATNGIQSQALLAAPNAGPIFIRGTQPDGTPGMFIQQSPQATAIQTQQNQQIATQGTVQQVAKPRPSNENIQPKQPTSRPLNILPSNTANIRPASSVSTQTIGAQTPASMGGKPGQKIRSKTPQIRTSPAPKADAANQTQIKPYNNIQQHHIVPNKMLVMNTSTGITTLTPGSPMTAEKAQQIAQGKPQQAQTQVQTTQQQTQQVILQQQAIQQSQQQQQALQQFQLQQGQPQHIQPKPMMTVQTIQGIPQQQIQMAGDRPIMPVVSMSAAQGGQVQQTLQQTLPAATIQQGLPLQSNLAVTQQQMQMQQIHQIQQMAPPGTIIGQLAAPNQPAAIPQVTNHTQIQQLQQGAQQMTITTPQQVPLPPTVPQVKDTPVEPAAADSASTPSAETPKENGIDTTSSQNEVKDSHTTEPKSLNGVESSIAQPTPIPGTVPTQPTNPSTENGLPIAATAEEVKERCPPKAMVKPQVLTHVIEDFVIQESSEPFPVARSSLMGDIKPTQSSNDKDDEPPRKKRASSPSTNGLSPKGETAKCEACGTVDLKSKFKKNKRFCSVACSKSNKDKKHKWGDKDNNMEVDTESGASGAESSFSPNGNAEDDTPKIDPIKWSVQEVFDFIKNLPGCSDYAEDFLIQEIDGQALMLLKEDHLMTAMAMKLGPALKIVAKIDDMRIDKEPPKQN